MIRNSQTQSKTGPQLEHFDNRIGLFFNTDKWNRDQFGLSSRIGWNRTLCRMKLDPTIALLRQLFIAPILVAGWSVDADDDAPDEMVDFVQDELLKVRVELLRVAGLGCLDWGWAPFEKVFRKRDDGRYGIKKLKPLLQSMTEIEIDMDTGAFVGLRQGDKLLTREESLLFYFDVEGTNWYGNAPMRALEKPFAQSEKINVQSDKFNNRIAASHWVIFYPPGTTVVDGQDMDNYDLATSIMQKLLATGSAVLPATVKTFMDSLDDAATGSSDAYEWKIELLSAGDTSGGSTYIEQQKYYNTLKARGIGFPERSVFEGQHGTKAEAGEHGDQASMGLGLRLNELTGIVTKHLVRQLLEANWGPKSRDMVKLKSNPLRDAEKEFLLGIYDKLIGNVDVLLQEYDNMDLMQLREKIGLPMKDEAEQDNLLDREDDKDDDPLPTPDDQDSEDNN